MRYNLNAIPPKWRDFARCHQRADASNINSKAFGIDEQLDVMLTATVTGTLRSEEQLFTLRQNRSRKHRRRHAQLLSSYARQLRLFEETNPLDILVNDEDIMKVRSSTTEREWQCLWLLALGESFGDIAAAIGVCPGTAKSLVSRCRARLRLLLTTAS